MTDKEILDSLIEKINELKADSKRYVGAFEYKNAMSELSDIIKQ